MAYILVQKCDHQTHTEHTCIHSMEEGWCMLRTDMRHRGRSADPENHAHMATKGSQVF